MKKVTKFAIVVVIILLMFFIGLIFGSCDGCTKKTEAPLADVTLVVEDLVKADNAYMTGRNYRWYETCVLMNDYLDEETDGSIKEVVNVFQVLEEAESGFDTKVFKFQHFTDGSTVNDSVHGFWIEDFPLVDSLIAIPYDSAFTLVQQVNFPKPHSRNAVLRNPIGPIPVNPQWVFGNITEQLWVDALTGDIKMSNPAFPDGFKMPLGEWP